MDERLKWLETRISSSLRPRNEELKAMLASDENRLAFHEFIKNEDSKSLYVYVKPPRKIVASLKAPHGLHAKSIFFMKSQGAKLTRDNIGKQLLHHYVLTIFALCSVSSESCSYTNIFISVLQIIYLSHGF